MQTYLEVLLGLGVEVQTTQALVERQVLGGDVGGDHGLSMCALRWLGERNRAVRKGQQEGTGETRGGGAGWTAKENAAACGTVQEKRRMRRVWWVEATTKCLGWRAWGGGRVRMGTSTECGRPLPLGECGR